MRIKGLFCAAAVALIPSPAVNSDHFAEQEAFTSVAGFGKVTVIHHGYSTTDLILIKRALNAGFGTDNPSVLCSLSLSKTNAQKNNVIMREKNWEALAIQLSAVTEYQGKGIDSQGQCNEAFVDALEAEINNGTAEYILNREQFIHVKSLRARQARIAGR